MSSMTVTTDRVGVGGLTFLVCPTVAARPAYYADTARIDAPPEPTITSRNRGYLDVNIWLVASASGARVELGLLPGRAVRNFATPTCAINLPVRVLVAADPEGAPVFESDVLLIGPQNDVAIVVTPAPSRSLVTVWERPTWLQRDT